jgi:hypothetical protein
MTIRAQAVTHVTALFRSVEQFGRMKDTQILY